MIQKIKIILILIQFLSKITNLSQKIMKMLSLNQFLLKIAHLSKQIMKNNLSQVLHEAVVFVQKIVTKLERTPFDSSWKAGRTAWKVVASSDLFVYFRVDLVIAGYSYCWKASGVIPMQELPSR